MSLSRMDTTVLLLIVLHSMSVAAAQRQPSVALPGCRDTCGNITVPYPFGIGAGCYRDDGVRGFQLECDDSGPSPPRLTIVGRGYRLAAISPAAGEATTYLNATRACYNTTSGGYLHGNINYTTYMDINESPYLFSSTKTQLVALGCPTLGYFEDDIGQYVSGCMSMCRPAKYKLPDPCTGVGCCRSEIPKGVHYFDPHQNNFRPDQDGFASISAQGSSCHFLCNLEKAALSL